MIDSNHQKLLWLLYVTVFHAETRDFMSVDLIADIAGDYSP